MIEIERLHALGDLGAPPRLGAPGAKSLEEQSGHRVWLVLLDSQRRWWTAHRIITDAFATAGRAERSHETTFAGT